MILKNSLIYINQFFFFIFSSIRKLYLKSEIYNKKISKINSKYLDYRPSPSLLDSIIKYSNNKNLINEHNLKFAKKNLILVNTSRGEVIDENHLYNFLKQNPNASACLDVFKTEPYKGKLIYLNNVILSPHLSSYSQETRKEMELFAIRTIIKEFKI